MRDDVAEMLRRYSKPGMLRRISKPGWLYIAGCSCVVISAALGGSVLFAIFLAGCALLVAAFICGVKREMDDCS